MRRHYPGWLLLLLSLSASARADEFAAALGVFNLARSGVDLLAAYRPAESRWQYGFRHVGWTDTATDPFTGRDLTATRETLSGPVVNYLFMPERRHNPYVGVSLLRWSRTETPLALPGPSGSSSTTDLYFGGGYQGRFGTAGFYNTGMYLSPTASMHTQTAISSSDQSGNFDIQLQVGLAW